MCFCEFEDGTGTIEGILFADLYEKAASELNEGAIFRIGATISSANGYKEDENAKLIVNALDNMEGLDTDVRTLYINIPSDAQDDILKIRTALMKYQGDSCVRLCFSDTRQVTRPKGIKGVKITKELLELLGEICGKSNILVK